jgi:hypothetical protein
MKPPLKFYFTKFEDLKLKDGVVDKQCQLAGLLINTIIVILWFGNVLGYFHVIL